jgi:hypothetical protein
VSQDGDASLRTWTASALGHLALALVVTAPGVATLGTRLLGDPRVDVWNHAWGAWWFTHSAARGELPLHTSLLNAPGGGWLWYIDPIGGAFGALLLPLVGLTAAWNLTLVGLVAAASAAGRCLARALGAGPRASWIGAAAVGASPHLVSELHNGISEAAGVAWGVFAFAAVLRAVDQPEAPRRWLLAGVLGGVTALGTYYYALGLALAAGVVLLDALWRGPRRELVRGMLVAAAPAVAIALPVVATIHFTVSGDHVSIVPRQAGAWQDRLWAIEHNAVDPQSLLRPGGFQSVDLTPLGEAFRHTSYLGWVALLAAARAPRRRLLALAAAVPLLFSLGPFLWVNGAWVKVGGSLLALPYRVLLDVLPAGAIAHPQRLGFVGIAIVGGLAASALRERWAPAVAALLLGELLLLSPAPWPLARAPAVDVRAAEEIARLAGASPSVTVRGVPPAVLDLPVEVPGEGMSTSRYLFFQTIHGQPIPFGPNVRKDGFRLYGSRGAVALVFERPEDVAEVTRADFVGGDLGFVVLHPDLGDVSAAEALLRRVVGEPREIGPALLWDLRGPPPPGPPPGDEAGRPL